MPRLHIKTFGCQMNEQDSETMALLLKKEGYRLVEDPMQADLVLINTCSIREKAYHKALSEIGRYRQPSQQVGVTGCVASQEGKGLLKRFPQLDFVLGTDQIPSLPSVVKKVLHHQERISLTEFQDISDYEFPQPLECWDTQKVKAYVTIMKGCDNHCSFCIVPFTRGKEVSRTPENILEEIHSLENHGVREVMLLGQNVNSYGKRLEKKVTFAELLRYLEKETRLARIRFTSPHPKDLSRDLIDEYGRNAKLCPHLHLPVQSGSNSVLKRMRRAYTREVYLKKIEKLRQVRPDIALTTDFIVGFPGETDSEFQETLGLLREVEYDQSYSFEFSPRPGTEAARFPDDVPTSIKKERLVRLQQLQEEISLKRNQSRIGLIEEVLVEGSSQQAKQDQLTGRSIHGKVVNFDGGPAQIGAIIAVKIREATAYSLKGVLC